MGGLVGGWFCCWCLRSYLEPIRNSMQKPIGGSPFTKRGRSVLAVFKLNGVGWRVTAEKQCPKNMRGGGVENMVRLIL